MMIAMSRSAPNATAVTEAAVNGSSGNRRPKSLILDVYGRYRIQLQGWIAVSDLVSLMALLDVDEQAVRSAVSRMTRRGLLEPEVRERTRGYRTTDEANEIFAEADRRIYASMEPARLADGWALVNFSLPERDRDKRHLLRTKLMWHGMGNLASGLWIGPARVLDSVTTTVVESGLAEYTDVFRASYEAPGEVGELVRHSWDLERLAGAYQSFLEIHEPVVRRLRRLRRPVGGDEAFTYYTRALHDWRKFPYLDPGLPPELLPGDWPGRDAAELFAGLRSELEEIAFAYVESVVARPR